MNHNFFANSHEPPRPWNSSAVTNQIAPQLQAPNFSGFSASPDKPFMPLFGVQPPLPAATPDPGGCTRKRRSEEISTEMEMEARQRKVFISEERMVNRMSRLNLDQGPDILQDLAPQEEEPLFEEVDLDDVAKPDEEAESFKDDLQVEIDEDERLASGKVVLSETLKDFVDRKAPILPVEVVQRITQQHQPLSLSRELVLWTPPGEQIRETIRKTMQAEKDETVQSGGDTVMSGDSPASPLRFPTPVISDHTFLSFDCFDPPPPPPHMTNSILPDLVMDQPASLLSSEDSVRRTGAVTGPYHLSNANWSFEQMET